MLTQKRYYQQRSINKAQTIQIIHFRLTKLLSTLPLDKINLNTIEEEVKEALKGFEIEEGPYLSEQSDKEHVIISLRIAADVDNWKKAKSEALKGILALRHKIIKEQTV